MAIGYGEYILNSDPYNFETEEEFIKFYHPEILEEIKNDDAQNN